MMIPSIARAVAVEAEYLVEYIIDKFSVKHNDIHIVAGKSMST